MALGHCLGLRLRLGLNTHRNMVAAQTEPATFCSCARDCFGQQQNSTFCSCFSADDEKQQQTSHTALRVHKQGKNKCKCEATTAKKK